ncbi:MAG: NAD-dependent epimerase/dehydratase family protein [Candidatus Latescibacteria bacterium]|jgi:nucleoside-diphosphate-sugar epimerase|nr:NAD-dependent epimerase/dehydratase family protein [Candidatus Latescibacterota bacterium]
MRLFIIGGTRFIGHFVTRQLIEQGHDVTVFHRGQTPCDLPDSVQHIHGHRDTLADFTTEIDAFKPDVVLDMISMFEKNADTVMSVFQNRTDRVVLVSSCDVYKAYGIFHGKEQGQEPTPLTEDAPVRDVLYPYRTDPPRDKDDPQAWADHYDKIPIEHRVLNDANLPGTVLRLPAVYGPNDGQHRLFPTLKRIDDKRPFMLLEETCAKWRFCRGYVENVAAGIVLALTNPVAANKIYNISETYTHTTAEWDQKIADATQWSGQIKVLPQSQMPKHLVDDDANWTQNLNTDSTRIRQELGYQEIVPLDEALLRTIAWERENSPKQIDEAQFDYAAEDQAFQQYEN